MSSKASKQFKKMSGCLQLKANHKWTEYDFATCGVFFHYFNRTKSFKGEPKGQLLKTQLKEVKPTGKQHKGAENCFEVHHGGSSGLAGNSPWVLSAPSHEKCIEWMECLQPGSSALLKMAPTSNPASPRSPRQHQSPPYNGHQQHSPYNGQQQSPFNGHQQIPHNAYQQGPHNDHYFPGNQQGSLHDSMNLGHGHNAQHLTQTLHGSTSFSGTLPMQSTGRMPVQDRNAFSTPVTTTREEFLRQAERELAQNNRVESQGGAMQNNYVSYGSSKPVDVTNKPEEDDRYVANVHARSLSAFSKSNTTPSGKTQQQQQPQKPIPTPRLRPQMQPRSKSESHPTKLESQESYEYMSHKGVPEGQKDLYDDSIETLGRVSSASNLPPKPPMRPRHTLQTIDRDNEDVFDGKTDPHCILSPSYVDPKELNTVLPKGGSLDCPSPPLPRKRNNSSQSSEKSYADFLRYFSPEQMQQLADMFKEVAGVQERGSPQQLQKQLSSSDVVSALRRTSQNLPDQILNEEDQYVIGEDDSTKKWARASSKPHGKRLDKLAEDVDDPIYQMQKEAFTIEKEALSDFRVIGKGQYGVVEAALYTPSPGSIPIKVAIKKTKETCSQLEKDNFHKEIVVMAQFMHPNIVRVFGSVDKGVSSPWLVLEFLSNGDLKSFLKCNDRPVHRLVKYMVDIAMGMHYLSEKGFVHRDLAARNIFLDENELCKVGDFGLLRETTSGDNNDEEKHYVMQSELALPVRWMAVECLTKQIFSSASDVWSFGVLMWELFNPLVRPYRKIDNMTVIAAVSAGRRLDIPEKCPTKVGQVMQACWNADHTKRPSFLVIANLLCRCIQQETPSRK